VKNTLVRLKKYNIGKPLVIGGLFPIYCSQAEMEGLISDTAGTADGWINSYWGKTREQYETERKDNLLDGIKADWLNYFSDGPPPSP